MRLPALRYRSKQIATASKRRSFWAIVLIAGVVAFPASVKHKLIAIVAGFCFVQALNIVSIISLLYLGQWNYTVFEWFHLYRWPVPIMLDVLVVFAIYVQ
jgi:exosortase H (IPTLxxWG-CTERM-specific)